ncbi:putative nuclease HARBI1 [Pseudorasbora parva]|uniref:putative nuclease HARBI1 n=1 Tax=Pseudorasbora parva TaxID=51549 RepID=UPI00351E6A9E
MWMLRRPQAKSETKVYKLEKPLEPRRRLAIVLWWYATPGEYRTIGCLFGVGLSTVCTLVHEVTATLKRKLFKRFISLPRGEALQNTINGFAQRGYPLCAGAIDGSHIPIIAPQEDAAAYYNRKGWHSIVLQAVVDHNFCFTDVYVGWPGRTHDARVLSNSPIFQTAEENGGYLFPRENSRIVNGVEVPVHLIGDAAYPLKKWLMKGFTNHQALTPQQRLYNYRLSSARMDHFWDQFFAVQSEHFPQRLDPFKLSLKTPPSLRTLNRHGQKAQRRQIILANIWNKQPAHTTLTSVNFIDESFPQGRHRRTMTYPERWRNI